VVADVRRRKLTYLDRRALLDIGRAVRAAERSQVPGMLIEAGTALGGSAVVMAVAKRRRRPLVLYDVFGTIPPPGDGDGPDVHRRYDTIVSGQARGLGGETYYGYRGDLYEHVVATLTEYHRPPAHHAITLVRGRFEDTLSIDAPVALAHLDGDWYSSTMTCLERIVPFLSPGGRIIIDDYRAWSGCRRAVDEYFAVDRGCRREQHARVHFVRDPTETMSPYAQQAG
jgi:predicted O-methyltransferase YrrM